MPKLEKFDLIVNTQILHCIEITTNSVYTYVYLESLAIEFSRSFAAKCECRPLSFFLTISLGFSTMLQLWLTCSILYIKCISINNNILLKLNYPTRVYESDECKMHGEKFNI